MKKPLVRGVHYIPAWVEPERVCDGPAPRRSEEEQFKRERRSPTKRLVKRAPEKTEAIRKALDTTYSRAVTIAILIEAGDGGIVPHEDLGQTINHANTAVANTRVILGKRAVINHPGQGYSLAPSVRAAIIERAGLSDE